MSNGDGGGGGAQGAGAAIVAAVGTAAGSSVMPLTIPATPSGRLVMLSAKNRVVTTRIATPPVPP